MVAIIAKSLKMNKGAGNYPNNCGNDSNKNATEHPKISQVLE
jgi:hypothetical protein